ncbi:SURF1 family protein [Streptomyces harbinensis]|uniref:SURF1 family cytochrome oxidase biogenesis protein n=1 Tax=Streptomyces harbinensis TaxID=1176198 RepID=UPI0034DEBB33
MYRFLLTRQWVILTLVALALIPAFVWLGFWQLHRHEQRVDRNELISRSLAAPVVPMDELSSVGAGPDPADRFRPVSATGVYDAGHEVLTRSRTGPNDEVGYLVQTPLIRDDGTAVLVNRGWVPAGGDVTVAPEVPAPPAGEVTVTGRLMVDETTGNTGIKDRPGLPDRMVMLVNSEQRAAELGTPMLGGFIDLTDSSPADEAEGAPLPRDEPDHTGIGAHFAYAIQWWIFAAGVPAGWIILLRRELHDQAAEAKKRPATPDPATGPEPKTPATAGTAG